MSDDTTQPIAKTICSLCSEDLNPVVEDLQAISTCGHVFHELCIQQWFEYYSKGKKQCPICKQTCAASNVSRLYFQSVGDSNDSNLSQKLQTHKEDTKELNLVVRRLEGKVSVLNLAIQSRENDINNISNELCACKEELKKEASLKNETLKQKHEINDDLISKTLELSKTDLECDKLQKGNMGLAKELAALKLVSDLDLEEAEIVKLASLGTEPQNKESESVDILNKSLTARANLYTALMGKCNKLGSHVTRSRTELEKAKEQLEELEKLKKELQKLEKAKEMKDNGVLRALNASQKTKKYPNVRIGVNPTLSYTCPPQNTIKDPDIHLGKTKRLRVSDNINGSNNKDDVRSCILIDDDAPKVSVSRKFSSNDSVRQPTKWATTDASYLSKNVHDGVFVHENGQDKPLINIVKEASSPVLNHQEAGFCFSNGLLDGTNRHPSKWCKNGRSKASGDLIVYGADGRGGTTKVLKHLNLTSSNSRGSLTSAKSSKHGAKASSLQSRGQVKIDYFYSKAGP